MTTSWVEVVDTAVKIGFGALIAGLMTFLHEYLRRRADVRQQQEELVRSRFIEPIVAFLDEFMGAVGEAYWAHIDGREARMPEKMAFFQERQGAIEARVLALGDEELVALWRPFTRKVAEIRIRTGERDFGDPYEKMQEAFDLGGKILRRLFRLPRSATPSA